MNRHKFIGEVVAQVLSTAASAANVKSLGEVISYANEEPYAGTFNAALEAFRASKPAADDIKGVNDALKILVRGKVISADRIISGTK